ncbi:MAG: DNA topoisomerase I [Nanoarchaeota archaeon]
MVNELIITEKPSSAKKIAEALADSKVEVKKNKGVSVYTITHGKNTIKIVCAVGHLFTVAEKTKSFKYPSFDIEWKPVYETNKNSAYAKKYADTIKQESKKIDSFIVACDYDVEGEVIGLNVVRFLAGQKDAKRMKFSTLTTPDLLEAYDNKSNTLDWGQARAGETRHFLDWMYGINLSRALTLAIKKNNRYKMMSSGRVQGPTLKILSEREKEIQAFKPEPFWQLQLLGKKGNNNIEAWHKTDKFWKENEVDSALKNTKGKDGIILNVEAKDTEKLAPFPFDLTNLQTESYRHFGYTPKRTLDIAQQLYSNGFISYPRTSSQQLTPKLGFSKILSALAKQSIYKKHVDFLLAKKSLNPNNGTKTDPAHPAIYPTGIVPSKLKDQEIKVYDLVVKRFFATFGDPAARQTITADIAVNSELFILKGTKTKIRGWFELYEPYVKLKEEELPALKKDDKIIVKEINKIEKETQPPNRYTQASIIKDMEKRGLGTKSTRAQILESLIDRKYIQGNSIEVTKFGLKTIDVLEKYSPEIVEEELTRYFELEMKKIREDKAKPEDILEHAKKELTKLLGGFKKNEKEIGKKLLEAFEESQDDLNGKRILGKDPKTGRDVSVRIGRYGPFVQLGTKEEKDKPVFSSLPKATKLETITLEEAVKLFELPRIVGEEKGGKIEANVGRYGPYVKYQSKFYSIGEEDPYKITLKKSIEIIKAKEEADKKKVINEFGEIKVLHGRYGPYVTDGNKNAKIPKNKKPEELTLEDCKQLLQS